MDSRAGNFAGAFVLPILVTGLLTRTLLPFVVRMHVPRLPPAEPVISVVLGVSPIVVGLAVGLPFVLRLFQSRTSLWLAYCLLMGLALWLAMAAVTVLSVGIIE